jgi:CRP-like cAMP-binding protein
MANFFSRSPLAGDCERCPLHRVDVMGDMPPDERAALLPLFRLRRYEPRDTVHGERDAGTHVAMVRGGLIKLVRYSASGEERIVRLAMPGDTIGLELMVARTYEHTAIALTPAELCLMPLDVVEQRASRSPAFVKKLFAEWHASVDEAERFLTELSTGTAHQRVARLLLFLQERVQGTECPAIGREDMGSLLGVTTETASRVVAEYKRAGLLREDAQGHWTCNRAGLEQHANGWPHSPTPERC